jgi:hypothetical protein
VIGERVQEKLDATTSAHIAICDGARAHSHIPLQTLAPLSVPSRAVLIPCRCLLPIHHDRPVHRPETVVRGRLKPLNILHGVFLADGSGENTVRMLGELGHAVKQHSGGEDRTGVGRIDEVLSGVV